MCLLTTGHSCQTQLIPLVEDLYMLWTITIKLILSCYTLPKHLIKSHAHMVSLVN